MSGANRDPAGVGRARRGLREEAGLHAGRSPPPALTRGLWLSGGWTQLRARGGFPGLESAPECRRPPGMGSRFPGGCGSGGGCLRRAEVRRGRGRSSAAAGALMGTRRPDTWGPWARRRTPGAPLSGVWLRVPRGLRLQFSFCFLHLLGERGETGAPSFWVSPATPSLPTSDHAWSSLQTCSPQILVSLRDCLHPLSFYAPASTHPRTFLLPLQKLPCASEPFSLTR